MWLHDVPTGRPVRLAGTAGERGHARRHAATLWSSLAESPSRPVAVSPAWRVRTGQGSVPRSPCILTLPVRLPRSPSALAVASSHAPRRSASFAVPSPAPEARITLLSMSACPSLPPHCCRIILGDDVVRMAGSRLRVCVRLMRAHWGARASARAARALRQQLVAILDGPCRPSGRAQVGAACRSAYWTCGASVRTYGMRAVVIRSACRNVSHRTVCSLAGEWERARKCPASPPCPHLRYPGLP